MTSGCRDRIRSPARPPSWPTCWPGGPGPSGRGRRRGPQGRPRRADPAAALGLAAGRWPRRNSCGPSRWSRRVRPGAVGCRWPAGGCRCSPSGPPPRSRCSAGSGSPDGRRRPPRAGRWPTWPRWPASPPTWPRAAGCCPCSPRRARPTPPGGAPCSAAPTRSGPTTWPRRCPPSCRAAGGRAPGPLLAGALDALADAAARARLPVSLLPARRGRTPARLPVAERFVLALTTTDARLEVATPQDEAWGELAALAAELDAWRDGAQIPGGPGAYLLPAGRARHAGCRSLAGRVRAAVRRRPQPDDLRRRRLGRARGRVPRRRRGRRPAATRWRSCWPGSAAPPGSSASSRTRCARPPRPGWSWTRRARSGSSRRPGRCWPAPGSACCCPTGSARPASG